jgi:hypothetical protein
VKKHWIAGVAEVNKELLLILSIVMSAGLINLLIAGQRMALTIYNLPTLFAAYYFGTAPRRGGLGRFHSAHPVDAYPAPHRARKRN